MITLITTIAGYLVTNYISGWEYRHREEKAAILKKLYYVQGKSQDRYLAKDVRIFGMENWLKELLNGHFSHTGISGSGGNLSDGRGRKY